MNTSPIRLTWFYLVSFFCISFVITGYSQLIPETKSQVAIVVDKVNTSVIHPLYKKYKTVPPKGKFASGAFVGFVTTKCATDATVKTAKYFGAAYIASEVLHLTGVLDNLDSDSRGLVDKAKHHTVHFIQNCRRCMRKQLDPRKIKLAAKNAIKKDKMTTLGATTGVIAGLVW